MINPKMITISPTNSLSFIISEINIAFSIMEEGGIIIVHNNKFPAPVVESILK